MNDLCACGHFEDEHDSATWECTVEDCPCFYYDGDLEDEDA